MKFNRLPVLVLLPLLAACSESGTTPTNPVEPVELVPVGMQRVQGDQQSVAAGTLAPQELIVQVSAGNGRGVAGVPVSFVVASGGGWVTTRQQVLTDERGRARTWWYMGPNTIGDHVVSAVSPYGGTGFRAYVEELGPGSHHVGAAGLVELRVGTLPLILSVPRGGDLEPAGFVDRSGGAQNPHRFTRELAEEVMRVLGERTGGVPTLVVSNLSPRKMDPDLSLPSGADPHTPNDRAWREFHGFLSAARANVATRFGGGVLLDVQGANLGEGVVQLGYLLTPQDLNRPDIELNSAPYIQRTSIRALVSSSASSLAATIRGSLSLGGLLESRGFESTPSPAYPTPNGFGYLPGGLTTAFYGSSNSGSVNAIFMETPFTGVRESAESRQAFAEALVDALDAFFQAHYGLGLQADLWAQR